MRKRQYPPEFEHLPPTDIAQIDQWLDDHPYRVVHEKLQSAFRIKISTNKLCRYCQARELAADIRGDSDIPFNARDLYQMMNGEELPFDELTLRLIEKKTFHHAISFNAKLPSVHKLLQIQRLTNYRFNRDMAERRVELDERRQNLADLKAKRAPEILPASTTVPKSIAA